MVDQGQDMALHQGKFNPRATKVTEIDPCATVLSVLCFQGCDAGSVA